MAGHFNQSGPGDMLTLRCDSEVWVYMGQATEQVECVWENDTGDGFNYLFWNTTEDHVNYCIGMCDYTTSVYDKAL